MEAKSKQGQFKHLPKVQGTLKKVGETICKNQRIGRCAAQKCLQATAPCNLCAVVTCEKPAAHWVLQYFIMDGGWADDAPDWWFWWRWVVFLSDVVTLLSYLCSINTPPMLRQEALNSTSHTKRRHKSRRGDLLTRSVLEREGGRWERGMEGENAENSLKKQTELLKNRNNLKSIKGIYTYAHTYIIHTHICNQVLCTRGWAEQVSRIQTIQASWVSNTPPSLLFTSLF